MYIRIYPTTFSEGDTYERVDFCLAPEKSAGSSETAESEMVAALASTFSVFGPTSPQVLQKGKGFKTQAGPHAIRQGSQQLSECRLHLAEALIL